MFRNIYAISNTSRFLVLSKLSQHTLQARSENLECAMTLNDSMHKKKNKKIKCGVYLHVLINCFYS